MTVNMTQGQHFTLTVALLNLEGDSLEKVLNWSCSDPAKCLIQPSVDTMSCLVTALDDGSCSVYAEVASKPSVNATANVIVAPDEDPVSMAFSASTPAA